MTKTLATVVRETRAIRAFPSQQLCAKTAPSAEKSPNVRRVVGRLG